MKNDKMLAKLRELAGAFGTEASRDLPAMIAGLQEMKCFSHRQVKLLADAVRADIVEDLLAPPSEAVRGIVRGRLISRMVSEANADFDEANWTVETWVNALWAETQLQAMARENGEPTSAAA